MIFSIFYYAKNESDGPDFEWRNVDDEMVNIGHSLTDMLVTVEGGSYHAPAHTIELLTLYPNPSDGEVTLHIGQDQWIGGSVIVYNILSQQMAQSTISKTSIDMDFSTQSAGVYLVVIQKGTAQETLQLIKN